LTKPNPVLNSTGFLFGYPLSTPCLFAIKEGTMKQKSVRLVFVLFMGMVMVVGVVWGLSAGAASPKSTATGVSFLDRHEAVHDAVLWLVNNHQNDDGGYTSFSTGANQAPSNAAGTMDAILALAAAGYSPAANLPGKTQNPVAYLRNNPADLADYASQGGGPAGKVVLGLAAANQDPRDFVGHNFVISLTEQLSSTGQYAGTAFDQSLALLSLSAVSETVPVSTTQWLKDLQAANGSWDDGFGTTSNPDASGMAVMALIAANEPLTSTSLISATSCFSNAQLPTGGGEYGPGFGENANSTALVIQALSALGEDFHSTSGPWVQNGNTPLSALLSWQNSTGAFQADFGFGRFDDFFTTAQAIPGATGKAYPLPDFLEAYLPAIFKQ
jgi:hypothetical protein